MADVYTKAGLPEWVRYPDRPDLGHHPDPDRPTHTRCGLPLADATPVDRPRLVHTDCLPRDGSAPGPDGQPLWDLEDGQ